MSQQQANIPEKADLRPDWSILLPSFIVILLVSLPAIVSPQKAEGFFAFIYKPLAFHMGTLYLWLTATMICLCLYYACSRWGDIKFGAKDDKPEFSLLSWTAMIFSASTGGAVIFWAITEPLWDILQPPQYAASMSVQAYDWALAYLLMHWGPNGWCTIFMIALPIGYMLYVRKEPFLRLSMATEPVIGAKNARGILGRCIDIFFILGLIFETCVTMCLSLPTVAISMEEVFGIKPDLAAQTGILVFSGLVAGYTVYKGLNKGIKWLSDANMILAVALVLYCFLCGPTVQIFNIFTNAFGKWLGNYPTMVFWTDPWMGGTFPRDWTIFYSLFWCGFGPFIGLFVARISRGRTIREILVFGTIGTVAGSCLIHGTFGAYSLYVQHSGMLDLMPILQEKGGAAAVVAVLGTLPFRDMVLLVYALLATIFLATTVNSAAYVSASTSTCLLPPGEQPEKWHRTFWCFAICLVALGLLSMGSLGVAKIFGNFAGMLMILPILLLMGCWFKTLKKEGGYMLRYCSKPAAEDCLSGECPTYLQELAKVNDRKA